MLKNKFMSAAAAMVLATTSGLAYDAKYFDENTSKIVAYDGPTAPAGYNPNVTYKKDVTVDSNMTADFNGSTMGLLEEATTFGDALIFPAFKQGDFWETEATVRNSSENAIVAKVVLYAADDTREIIDFNIYLSGKDVFKFKIANGRIYTSDSSAIQSAATPFNYPDDITDTDENSSLAKDISQEVKLFSEVEENDRYFANGSLETVESGYIVVYAMAESDSFKKNADNNGDVKLAYHENHKQLFLDYRMALDECRPGWRTSLKTMKSGMPTMNGLNAPLVNANCDTDVQKVEDFSAFDGSYKLIDRETTEDINFTDPTSSLYGEVRLYSKNSAESQARDLLINAKALKNFTDNNSMMLWSEGEYASIQDRRIKDNNGTAAYASDKILEDAKNVFNVTTSYYTYNADDKANALLFTQPFKRALIQTQFTASETTEYISKNETLFQEESKALNKYGTYEYYNADVYNNQEYGYFNLNFNQYNEDEKLYTVKTETSSTILTSPYVPVQEDNSPVTPYPNELQAVSNLEYKSADEKYFPGQNGYVEVTFSNYMKNTNDVLPKSVIVTQMKGSMTENEPQTNWVYAPVK